MQLSASVFAERQQERRWKRMFGQQCAFFVVIYCTVLFLIFVVMLALQKCLLLLLCLQRAGRESRVGHFDRVSYC